MALTAQNLSTLLSSLQRNLGSTESPLLGSNKSWLGRHAESPTGSIEYPAGSKESWLDRQIEYPTGSKEYNPEFPSLFPQPAKFFVCNVPFQAQDYDLQEVFQVYGCVSEIKLFDKIDPVSRQKKRCAFVDFSVMRPGPSWTHLSDAEYAISNLNQSFLMGRKLGVFFAKNQ